MVLFLKIFMSRTKAIYIVLYFITLEVGSLNVGFFDQPKFEGYWNYCDADDFDENSTCVLSENNNYRSVKIHNGTCVEMHVKNESVWITEDNADLGQSFKDGYAKKCDTYNVSLICPDGTFAKQIEWDTSFEMTKGIKLSCYSPEFYTSNATVLESHPNSKFEESQKRKCAAIYGLTMKMGDLKEAIVALDLKKNCTVGYAKGVRWSCDAENALTAINVVIENRTNYIKNADIICTETPDIASICTANDERQMLLSYNGNTSTTFTIQKKIGVGEATIMSHFNRNEFKFYSSSGFKIAKSISTLSDNFKTNLGYSNKTKFDWSSSSDNMWQEEQTHTLKIVTEQGCTTEVYEIVGKCSFMEVRSNECVQVNICGEESNETVVSIPDDIVNSTYRKDILKPVAKKIHKHKTGDGKNNAIKVVAASRPFGIPFAMPFEIPSANSISKLLRNFSLFNK